jgi:hypothetical protein
VTVDIVSDDSATRSDERPREWVTTAEAGKFLGGTSVTTTAFWDDAGSQNFSCEYANADNSRRVGSSLRLTGTSIVDAATEFAFRTAKDNPTVRSTNSISGVGIAAACLLADHHGTFGPKNELWVMLPGERLFEASDVAAAEGGESCDTLKKFALAAIPRIGA